MGGSTKTFTDLQVSNLLTPDVADAEARRVAKRISEGDAMTYFHGYRQFQKDYRKKYSTQFMERQGYAPSSTATADIVTEIKVKAYLELLYGYTNVNVTAFGDRYLTISEKGKHAIQQIAGYEFATGHIVVLGKYYNNYQYIELVDATQLEVTSTRLYDETIIQNLTDNYGYDGTNIYVGTAKYLVGLIDSTVNITDEYETVCTSVDVPALIDKTILTPVERIVNVVTELAYGTEASYASYTVTSGEVGTETRYWVDVANTQAIYDNTILDITAIIPMKEDNVMVDTGDYKLNRLLRKLNLSGDQLKAGLENPDMDSAYLMMGINPEYDAPITNEVLFKMFDYISPGSGDIKISLSKLSMTYKFAMTKSTIIGSIGAVGTYTRVDDPNPTIIDDGVDGGSHTETGGIHTIMTLRYQGNTSEYQELIITNFEQKYTVSGFPFTAYLDSTNGYCRLAIPLDLLNSLPYKKFVWIYERSLCMIAYAMQVVKLEWYETGAFATLMKIVGIVLTIMTLSAATSFYLLVVAILETTATAYIAMWVAAQVGGVAGVILGVIVGMLLVGGFKSFNVSSLTSVDVWLKMANQFINTMAQMQQHELDAFVAKSTQELEELSKQTEDMQEKLAGLDESTPVSMLTFDSAYAGTPNTVYQSIEQYCSGLINADVENIVNYDLQMEYAIVTRTTVWSGP